MYKTLYTLVFDVDAADDGGDDNSRDSLWWKWRHYNVYGEWNGSLKKAHKGMRLLKWLSYRCGTRPFPAFITLNVCNR